MPTMKRRNVDYQVVFTADLERRKRILAQCTSCAIGMSVLLAMGIVSALQDRGFEGIGETIRVTLVKDLGDDADTQEESAAEDEKDDQEQEAEEELEAPTPEPELQVEPEPLPEPIQAAAVREPIPEVSPRIVSESELFISDSPNPFSIPSRVQLKTPSPRPKLDPKVVTGAGAGHPAIGKNGGCSGCQIKRNIQPALRRHGGTAQGEASVVKALEWLRKKQKGDGSWGTNRDDAEATTGLALLCFLGHGETESARYRATIERARDYLIERQLPDGRWSKSNHDYGHAICTYAMSELSLLTDHSQSREAMERGVMLICDNIIRKPIRAGGSRQNLSRGESKNEIEGGLWDYNYDPHDRWDLSFSAFNIQALVSARHAGSEVAALDHTLMLARNGIKAMQRHDGFAYTDAGRSNHQSMRQAGAFLMHLLEPHNAPECVAARKAITKASMRAPLRNPYYHRYYQMNAGFLSGRPIWDAVNRTVSTDLVRHQAADGSWPGNGVDREGATAFAALTLMVYYRYLPGSTSLH